MKRKYDKYLIGRMVSFASIFIIMVIDVFFNGVSLLAIVAIFWLGFFAFADPKMDVRYKEEENEKEV